jgi:hypothetical protein
MTDQNQNQANQQPETKTNDKELNFRALEAKYQKALDQERQERERLQRELEAKNKSASHDDDEPAEDPYVDHKRLEKKLNKFGQNTQSEIQKAMEMAKHAAKEELKQEMWLENNPDFYDVLQHAEKFAQKAPKLAETILKMPEGFERQKLVYQNIKELGINKPEQKQSSIQEKIDANKKSPYYQPSGVGTAPYAQAGDFSAVGQKNAYEQMQKLKQQLRL